MKRLHALLLLLFLAACSAPQVAQVEQGVIDLTELRPGSGPVVLEGPWAVEWGQLLAPDAPMQNTRYLEVPGAWNELDVQGQPVGGKGVATYRLNVLLPDTPTDMSIRVSGVTTSHRIWINGDERLGAGVVSMNPGAMVPAMPNRLHAVNQAAGELELQLQVANDAHRVGGVRRSVVIGPTHEVTRLHQRLLLRDALIFALLLVVSGYTVLVFSLRHQERGLLSFGGFTAVIAARASVAGDGGLALTLLPGLDWALAMRLEYLLSWIGPGVGLLFVLDLYNEHSDRRVGWVVNAIGVMGAISTLVLAPGVFSQGIVLFQGLVVFTLLYVMVVLARGGMAGREGALPFLGAIFLYLCGVAFDLVFYTGAVGEAEVSTYAFLFMVVAEAVMLARSFTRSYNVIEQLSEDLTAANRELVETNTAISRFVPFEFLEVIERRSISEVQRGDHTRKDMEILFCDLRSFTTLIESLGPDRAFSFINEYLAHMEPEIHAHEGFISQYLGDCIMALFHGGADEALRAGIGMLRALERFNRDQGYTAGVPVRVGVGISSGPLMMGTIGGMSRLDSGVIGDPVNLASRLEGMTKMYGTPLLIAGTTRDRLTHPEAFVLREIDQVVAKGKTEAVRIYEVIDALPDDQQVRRQQVMAPFAEGLGLYRSGDFDGALERFETCLSRCPEDAPSRLYVQRCQDLIASPPQRWTGVTELTRK